MSTCGKMRRRDFAVRSRLSFSPVSPNYPQISPVLQESLSLSADSREEHKLTPGILLLLLLQLCITQDTVAIL